MRNTYIDAGPHKPEELIASVDRGLYCKAMGGGSVGPTGNSISRWRRVSDRERSTGTTGQGPADRRCQEVCHASPCARMTSIWRRVLRFGERQRLRHRGTAHQGGLHHHRAADDDGHERIDLSPARSVAALAKREGIHQWDLGAPATTLLCAGRSGEAKQLKAARRSSITVRVEQCGLVGITSTTDLSKAVWKGVDRSAGPAASAIQMMFRVFAAGNSAAARLNRPLKQRQGILPLLSICAKPSRPARSPPRHSERAVQQPG